MLSPYVLALDQGTTGSTALVFDANQKLLGKAYQEFQQIYPQPGWVEHNPNEIFAVTVKVGKEAISNSGLKPTDIAAIGITNQRETVVVWDRETSQPISNAIVWQCRRTAEMCKGLRSKGYEKTIREKTGLVLDPYFSATKVSWLLNHISGARERAQKGKLAFGTIDSWLIWKLTNGKSHVTDFTNASRTLVFDIHKRTWSKELCDLFKIPHSLLPQVRPSAGDFGKTNSQHFGSEILIAGVAGDQQAALYGHGATSPYQVKCTFGTGAFAVAFCGNEAHPPSKHGLLTTLACDESGQPAYALEGSIFMAGAIVKWLRDEMGLIQKASETEALSQSVESTDGVYLVPAFVGLGAPYWDADARAAILGMTRGTNRAHIVRAALESIAYQTASLISSMESDLNTRIQELRVDGGVVSNRFLVQFLADVLGIPVLRPPFTEVTGFGAARLAAIALNAWGENSKSSQEFERFSPKVSEQTRKQWLLGWEKAVSQVRSKKLTS